MAAGAVTLASSSSRMRPFLRFLALRRSSSSSMSFLAASSVRLMLSKGAAVVPGVGAAAAASAGAGAGALVLASAAAAGGGACPTCCAAGTAVDASGVATGGGAAGCEASGTAGAEAGGAANPGRLMSAHAGFDSAMGRPAQQRRPRVGPSPCSARLLQRHHRSCYLQCRPAAGACCDGARWRRAPCMHGRCGAARIQSVYMYCRRGHSIGHAWGRSIWLRSSVAKGKAAAAAADEARLSSQRGQRVGAAAAAVCESPALGAVFSRPERHAV